MVRKPTGAELLRMAKDTFQTDNVTAEQISYVMDMLRPSTYALRNHTIRGRPMTFHVSGREEEKVLSHRPWQTSMLNDFHPNLAIQKSRQLGLSEIGVLKVLHFLDTHSYERVKAAYAFPTTSAVQDFVKTRLDPVLQNGYYSTILDKDNDSLKVKKIRNSFVFFRTSSKPGAFEGIDTDYISLDEYDRANLLADSSAEQSMQSSKFKIFNRWSTPSIPNAGVNRLFEQSDQHHYLHKCDRCNHWNQLSYDDYDASSKEAGGNILTVNPDGVDFMARTVIPGSFQFVCKACGKPLDRWYNGEWVSRYPSRTQGDRGVRGYLISQMNAVWVSADTLKTRELNMQSKQSFYNYVLGFPFEDEKLAVREDDVYRNLHEKTDYLQDLDEYRFIAAGIDWGNTHWLSVMGMRNNGQIDVIGLHNVQKSGATDAMNIGADIEQIKMYLAKINPDIIIADIGDSGDKIAQLIQYYGEGKVYGCEYNSSPYSTGQFIPTWNENKSTVKVDKLTQNKRYISMMKEGMILHPNRVGDPMLDLYKQHWMNVTIRDEEDERTQEFKQVIGRRGPDHYSQASVYALIGLERLRDLHYGDGQYGFNSNFIDLDYGAEPTLPDIYNMN